MDAARLLARGELVAGGEEPEQAERDAALAAFGLFAVEPDDGGDAGDPLFRLWPEHVDALHLWLATQTQWRHQFAGPSGLDYAGVRAAPAFGALSPERREAVFAELCVMERAALGEWARQRAQGAARR